MATPKTTADSALGKLRAAAGRVGVVAGSGLLPMDVVEALLARGDKPYVVLLEGEAVPGPPFDQCDNVVMPIEQFADRIGTLRALGVTSIVFAGGISRRPPLKALIWRPAVLRLLPSVLRSLRKGDDALLRVVIGFVESRGFEVLASHALVPNLLAPDGGFTRARPKAGDQADISAAFAAAKAIGALDIGQAAVAIGGRTIALEGIEGTDGLLARVRELRGHGRLAGRKRGVLVKCAKPGQEQRADLPAIGPQTVDDAHAAGLAGIALEANQSYVLSFAQTVARADALGLFIVGVTGDDVP